MVALAEPAAKLGLQVSVDEVVPGRLYVVANHKGSGGGRSLLLNGHTDTVLLH